MADTFTIIYRTQSTSDTSAPSTPVTSVAWGDVVSKPFSTIGSRLSVSGGSLSADIQTWSQITGKPFVSFGDSINVAADVADTFGLTDSVTLSGGDVLVINKGLITEVQVKLPDAPTNFSVELIEEIS